MGLGPTKLSHRWNPQGRRPADLFHVFPRLESAASAAGGLVLASRWVPRNWCLRGQALRQKDVLSRCRARWEEDKRTQIQLIRVFEALAPAEPAWAWACRGFWGSGMMCMVMQRICQAPAEPAWTCRGFLRLWHQRAWSLRGFLRLLLSLHGYAEGF